MFKNPVSALLFIVIFPLFLGCTDQEELRKRFARSLVKDADEYTGNWYEKTVSKYGETKVEVSGTEKDFGLIPADMQGSWEFTIRNVGDNPLRLRENGKTCKCTDLQFPKEMPPNSESTVTVHFKTLGLLRNEMFDHSAALITNDPSNKELRFTIKGKIGTDYFVAPASGLFSRLMPDYSKKTETITFASEQWDSIEVKDIETSFGDLMNVSPVETPNAFATKYEVKPSTVTKTFKLTLSGGLDIGDFTGWIRAKIHGGGEVHDFEIPIIGKVVRRISIKGSSDVLSSDGVVDLGRIDAGIGKIQRFMLNVNDPEKEISISSVEAYPASVSARLLPINANASKRGLYQLELKIDENAETGLYLKEDEYARITIVFEHPRIKPVDLKLSYYVSE